MRRRKRQAGKSGSPPAGIKGRIKGAVPGRRNRSGAAVRKGMRKVEQLAIFGGTPVRETPIHYGKQYIDEEDIRAVSEVLRDGDLTCGPMIDAAERKLCEVTGAKYAVLVSNGTAALHLAALAAGFAFTFVLGGFRKKPEAAEAPKPAPAKKETAEKAAPAGEDAVHAHATGQMIPMEEVKDETFAQKMLGDGFAILPEDGEVCSPVNGTVTSVFDTKHAVCLVSDGGLEILIHIGIDTVNLQGKHFTTHVKDGDTVKAGQPLITFELEQVKKAGYDTVIPLVFTDPDPQVDVSSLQMRHVTHGENI